MKTKKRMGKKGIWVPTIVNIAIIIFIGGIMLFFFWWLMFGDESGAKDEISETETSLRIQQELHSILRTDADYVSFGGGSFGGGRAGRSYSGSSSPPPDTGRSYQETYADIIRKAYEDTPHRQDYLQVLEKGLKDMLDEAYGNENYGFFVDYDRMSGMDDIELGEVSSSEVVAAAHIPTHDRKVIRVRLLKED